MSKERIITLGDCLAEAGELAVAKGTVFVGFCFAGLSVVASLLYWPYSVINERIASRRRPLQLTSHR